MQLIVKRKGHSQPYDERKVYASIVAVCQEAGEPVGSAELVADQVTAELRRWIEAKHEVTSHDMRVQAASRLKNYNEAAADRLMHGKAFHPNKKTSKTKKPKRLDYDVIVIGTGAAGGVAARSLKEKGKNVAIVEQNSLGGECPNVACIPTKALLSAADAVNSLKVAERFGINTKGSTADYAFAKAWKEEVVSISASYESAQAFKEEGIAVISGHAHFIDPWTVSVHGKRYTAAQFLLATGSKAFVPPIPGLRESGYLTYQEVQQLAKPPKKLFVIGGGAVGCEFAYFFNAYETEVHITEGSEHLLGREDMEVGETLEKSFTDRGIKVHTKARVVKVETNGKQKAVTYQQNGHLHTVNVDALLLATGKLPNTDLGLENAGVRYSSSGVKVNLEMQTNVPHIFAAGDVVGGYMFTHVAVYQSRIASQNMTSPLKHRADYKAVPRCVYTTPEVATVGLTESELLDKKQHYQIGLAPMSSISRAMTAKEGDGFVKILADKKGVVLGASIVAPRAGEMIHELALAIQWRLKASKIDYTIHSFPSWSQLVQRAAAKINCR